MCGAAIRNYPPAHRDAARYHSAEGTFEVACWIRIAQAALDAEAILEEERAFRLAVALEEAPSRAAPEPGLDARRAALNVAQRIAAADFCEY